MAVKRMDGVGIVVEDHDAAIAFVEAPGLELDGRARRRWLAPPVAADPPRAPVNAFGALRALIGLAPRGPRSTGEVAHG